MKNTQINDFRQMDAKALVAEKVKKQEQIVNEKAALVQSGRKNSIQTRNLKKEVAKIETVLNEKLLETIQEEGKNGQN